MTNLDHGLAAAVAAVTLSLGIGALQPARAGFVTGLVVGGLVGSDVHTKAKGSDAKNDAQTGTAGVLAISETHDIIFCRTDVKFHPGQCQEHGTFFDGWVTPGEFAQKQGFPEVLTQGVAATDGAEYIVMMVKKQ